MGSERGNGSRDEGDTEDEEDYEEVGGDNRLLGFMFGNVDDAGELDVDYLDEDAKEHLDALADKLGPSLTDMDLSGKSAQEPTAAPDEDYDEKAEDAVDYEDIEEQYEGPEIQVTEEDRLLSKKDYFSSDVFVATLGNKSSVFDDENYDEDEDYEKEADVVAINTENQNIVAANLVLDAQNSEDPGVINTISTSQTIKSEAENEETCPTADNNVQHPVEFDHLDSVDLENAANPAQFQAEEPVLHEEIPDAANFTPLPLLCIEDGMAILRFSEIFGVHEPLKKRENREHRYTIPKDKYGTVDDSYVVEDDEEAFLRGFGQGFSFRKSVHVSEDDISVFPDDSSEFDDRVVMQANAAITSAYDQGRDSCFSAEPMGENLVLDLSTEWQMRMSPKFYLLDQQDWEDQIVWGNSPVSDNSVDSCELCRPESESLVCEGKELESGAQKSPSHNRIAQPGKDHDCCVCVKNHDCGVSASITVEPFCPKDGSKYAAELVSISCSESIYHPQLLRLESRLEMDTSDVSQISKQSASGDRQEKDLVKGFGRLAMQNKDLMDGSWLDNIIWESVKGFPKPRLILDLQDENMLFEVLEDNDNSNLQLRAGAMIITRTGKSVGGDSVELPGHGGLSGGRFNISNDKFYSNRKTAPQLKSLLKKRTAHGVKILHSIPGLKLQTMKPKLSNKDIANFHRPKALWYPHDNELAVREQEKLPTQGPMRIILKSLGGKGSKLHVDSQETVSSLKIKASKKLDFKLSECVKLFYSGKELEDHMTLSEQNVRTNSLLHLVRTKVHFLPMAQKLPGENKSLRPPGAFKKKSDLSVKDGHIFLMEYCEERPLLLGNAGMGARLCTYYQKLSPDDQAGDVLRSTNSGFGTVLTLDPADKSPFLGDIKPGFCQSSLETNMYRAPVFPHRVASTDYLLVRSAKGKLSIRRIDRIHVVGQQEPHMEVMSPASKGLQTYIMNRLLAFMFREFRAAGKRGVVPCIRADELSAQFPNISEPFLRKRLKHCADLQKRSNGRMLWVMRRNFHIPSEEELRRMVTPENVCAYESMQAGLHRLKRLGITRLAHLTGPTQLASLSSAMNQLPDEAIALAAASHIERELQITPWNLSSNFVACTSQDRENIERLEITGVGDPTGRGLGFSYVRLAPKAPLSNTMVKKKPVVGRNTTVTGTDADLRRLSMEAAREVLLKFNVAEEQIEKLTRWHRIAMIRKLSSEQAASGVEVDPTTIGKYARGQRMSFLQLQQQTREKCQEIWDRQVQSLSSMDGDENESDSEANSDLDSFAGDLENLLDAEECEEDEGDDLRDKPDKSDGVKGLKMRRHPYQAQLEEEIEDEAAEAAEIFRMLMDDDDIQQKKKKRERAGVKLMTGPVFEDTDLGKKPGSAKQTIGSSASVSTLVQRQSVSHEFHEVENSHIKKILSGKAKTVRKNDVAPGPPLKKKVIIEGVKDFKPLKERKSARERFVCGACGQLGHMRTNKNCPKYGEDPETQPNNIDLEKASGRPALLDPATQSQLKVPAKKMTPKTATEAMPVDTPDGEKSNVKPKLLKVKCASVDKIPDNIAPGPAHSSEQPSTSEVDGGNRSTPKVNKLKITNKMKPEDNQIEVPKPSIVIRPPTETVSAKKLIIKRPKEIINLDLVSQEGTSDLEYRKTKKIVDLTGSDTNRMQHNQLSAEKIARRKAREDRRFWEEEEKRRNAERLEEERTRRLEEEKAELKRYEEVIRMEIEEEQQQKAKKKKTKKRSELKADYSESYGTRGNSRWMPERDRASRRRSSAQLGRLGAENMPPTKRRRRGEVGNVGLANILERIVETLREKKEISYLFLKPVTKKQAPDYLDIVERPMDLFTIRDKIRNFEYKDRQEFRHDVWQITYNAHLYNDRRDPTIPPLADQLLEICDYLLSGHEDSLTEAEAGIGDD